MSVAGAANKQQLFESEKGGENQKLIYLKLEFFNFNSHYLLKRLLCTSSETAICAADDWQGGKKTRESPN